MNIQQYFEEKEQKKQEKAGADQTIQDTSHYEGELKEETVIPVIQEQARINTVQTNTATINVQKRVTEVEKTINIPLMREGYSIEKIPVNVFVETAPPVREEGDTIIIPVVREVLVVEKRLELVEELRITKQQTTIEHQEKVTLKKEEVEIKRIPIEKRKL